MNTFSWENWAARILGRRSLVEPPELVLRRAISIVPGRRRRALPGWMAAAAVLIVGVGGAFLLNRSDRPALPPRTIDSTVRSGEIAVSAPAGRLDTLPTRFSWDADARATSYSVKLFAVDDTVLFEGTATTNELELPSTLAAEMHRAVTYTWIVEAFDANGTVVARSQPTRFDLRP